MEKRRKSKSRYTYYIILSLVLVVLLVFGSSLFMKNQYKVKGDGPIKVFYLNSFHSRDFPLAQENIEAFLSFFEEKNIELEIKQFDMDILRNPKNKTFIISEAKILIDEYDPDLIYATDDAAQEVISEYYINSGIPVVFSGVNEDPEKYGYDKAKNVAGVLERVHFIDTMNFLLELYPNIKTVGVIGSDYYLWDLVMERMLLQQDKFQNIDFVGWNLFYYYSDYKEKILEYQDEVDALVILGLSGIKEDNEYVVPDVEFERWTTENNNLPDITFWNFHVSSGNLLSVDVSPVEQGRAAADMAYKILIEGHNPSDIEFISTEGGIRNINLKRAEQLGISKEDIPSIVLVNSNVYDSFSWEE